MTTPLDCVPCLARQALDAARSVSSDPNVHEQILRDLLSMIATADLRQSPPAIGQRIHRRLRELTGNPDPYRAAKERFNRLALDLLPALTARVDGARDRFDMALRLAAAGNLIDLATRSAISDREVRHAIDSALSTPVVGDVEALRAATHAAGSILYLADNAGEIVFDRLLIERLPAGRVTVAVRGRPVINDATLADARAAGLDRIAEVIDNGSDAPGTVLDDCSAAFRSRFHSAGLIIAKGQGNFETLSDTQANIFFLLKIKCPLVAQLTGTPVGSQALIAPRAAGRA